MPLFDVHGQPLSSGSDDGAPKPGTADLRELGLPGTSLFSGILSEERNPALQGAKGLEVWKSMGHDPTIAMLLKVFELPLRACDWHVDPADDSKSAVELADFAHYSLFEFGMSGSASTWDDTLRTAVTGRNQMGFNLAEICYRIDDDRYKGKVCWDKLAWRNPTTRYKWNVEEVDLPDGGTIRKLTSMTQWAPPFYRYTVIPADKFLLWVRDMTGENFDGPLALDTPIPTPTGWTTMGAIGKGDEVIDEKGIVRRVVGTSPVLTRDRCYEVRLRSGETFTASADHLWFARDFLDRKKGRPGHVVTTEEMAARVQYGRGVHAADSNWSIPQAAALDLPEATLPVDPYVLGAWLGDGTSASAGFALGKQDAEEVEAIMVVNGSPIHQVSGVKWTFAGRVKGYRGGIQTALRRLGVIGNKHVPAVYLRGSVAQRLALLQGLMDTDGSARKDGLCVFTNTNRTLVDNVIELVASLGGSYVETRRQEPSPSHPGPSGRAIIGRQPTWQATFSLDKPAFRIARKLLRQRLNGQRRDHYITSITPVAPVPVKCLMTDGPSHLFLAGRRMVPTHNTPLLRACFKPWWIRDRLYNIQTVGLERSYMGMPVGKLPLLYTKDMKDLMTGIVQGMRTHEHSGAVIREDMTLEMLFNKVDGTAMQSAIQWHTYEIARSALAQFTMLGSNETGSFALAQPYSSSVLTPQGFVPMGELSVGDRVADALGGVQRVRAIQERGELDVYEMHFGDGRVVECSPDHLWAVTTPHWKRKGVPRSLLGRGQHLRLLRHGSLLAPPAPFDPLFGYGVLTAAEIKNRLESSPSPITFEVPPVEPVDYDEGAKLPIEPYLMGLLLGDGWLGLATSNDAAVLTTADAEVVAAVRECVPAARVKAKPGTTAVNVVLSSGRGRHSNPWTMALHGLGLRGHKAWEKFIPEAYQRASVNDRVALMQGLMDTDGTSANGQVVYGTTSPRLADDIERLARGLGSTSVHRRERPISGPLARHETYVVDFDCPSYEPFRVPRKLAKYRPKACTQGNKIVRVVATGRTTRMRCISITGSSHLYLTDGFVPTHNSTDQSDLFLMGLNSEANYTAEVVNLEPGIPTLINFNYPNTPNSMMPKLAHGDVGQRNVEHILRGLASLIQWGGIIPDDATEDALREMIGLPQREETITPEYLDALLTTVVDAPTDDEGRTHTGTRPGAPGSKDAAPTSGTGAPIGGGGSAPPTSASPAGAPAVSSGTTKVAAAEAQRRYLDAKARAPMPRPQGRLTASDRIRIGAAEEMLALAEQARRPNAKPDRPSVRLGKTRRPYALREEPVAMAEPTPAPVVAPARRIAEQHQEALTMFLATIGKKGPRHGHVPLPAGVKLDEG